MALVTTNLKDFSKSSIKADIELTTFIISHYKVNNHISKITYDRFASSIRWGATLEGYGPHVFVNIVEKSKISETTLYDHVHNTALQNPGMIALEELLFQYFPDQFTQEQHNELRERVIAQHLVECISDSYSNETNVPENHETAKPIDQHGDVETQADMLAPADETCEFDSVEDEFNSNNDYYNYERDEQNLLDHIKENYSAEDEELSLIKKVESELLDAIAKDYNFDDELHSFVDKIEDELIGTIAKDYEIIEEIKAEYNDLNKYAEYLKDNGYFHEEDYYSTEKEQDKDENLEAIEQEVNPDIHTIEKTPVLGSPKILKEETVKQLNLFGETAVTIPKKDKIVLLLPVEDLKEQIPVQSNDITNVAEIEPEEAPKPKPTLLMSVEEKAIADEDNYNDTDDMYGRYNKYKL